MMNETVQLLYISINLLTCDLITAVMIVGFQCITMVQNRYQFYKRLV